MRKFVVVLLVSAFVFALGCSKEAPKPPVGGESGMSETMPQPVFVPNAGANWKSAKLEVAAKDGSESQVVELAFDAPEKAELTVAGVKLGLKAIQMVPDFVMTNSNSIGSRSTELNNPAVQVTIIEDEKDPVTMWLFVNLPAVHAYEHELITIAATGFVEKSGSEKAADSSTDGGASPH